MLPVILHLIHLLIECADMLEVGGGGGGGDFWTEVLYSLFRMRVLKSFLTFCTRLVRFIKREACYGNGYVKYLLKNCSIFRFTINVFYKI